MMVSMCICKIIHGKSVTFRFFAQDSCEMGLNIIYKFREDSGQANAMNWKEIRKECET